MQDEPTPTELTKAVADFLRNEIAPAISGHNAFKLRVAINALDLVTRQLALEQAGDVAEAARLTQLLGMQGSLVELRGGHHLLKRQVVASHNAAQIAGHSRGVAVNGRGRGQRSKFANNANKKRYHVDLLCTNVY